MTFRQAVTVLVFLSLLALGAPVGSTDTGFGLSRWTVAVWAVALLFGYWAWGAPRFAQWRQTTSPTALGLRPPTAPVTRAALPDLAVPNRDAPDAALRIARDGAAVYLEVLNRGGRSAAFHATIHATGVTRWPRRPVFARWASLHTSHCDIAQGGRARVHLARWVTSRFPAHQTARHWVIYTVTDTGVEERVSSHSTMPGSEPGATDWQVVVDVTVQATPHLVRGPRRCRVILKGDGTEWTEL